MNFRINPKCTIYFCRSCGVTSSKDIPQQDYRCAAKLVVYLLCEVLVYLHLNSVFNVTLDRGYTTPYSYSVFVIKC